MMSSNQSKSNNNNNQHNRINGNNRQSGESPSKCSEWVCSQVKISHSVFGSGSKDQVSQTSYLHRQLSSGFHQQQYHYQQGMMERSENHVQQGMMERNENHVQQGGKGSSPICSSPICSGCHRPISERYLLRALDQHWHEDCLKCNACECRLGEVGSILYQKANQILCKRDYLRMFGKIGVCAVCQKRIEAYEMVMKAQQNNYHLDCFSCSTCNHRFCVGDKFSLIDNRIFCEYDALLFKGSSTSLPRPNSGKASTSK